MSSPSCSVTHLVAINWRVAKIKSFDTLQSLLLIKLSLCIRQNPWVKEGRWQCSVSRPTFAVALLIVERKTHWIFCGYWKILFLHKINLSEMPCSSDNDHRSTVFVNCRKSQKSCAALVYPMHQRGYPTVMSTKHRPQITRSINLLNLEMMNQIKTKPDTKHTLKLQKYTEEVSQQPGFCCMRFGLLPRNNAVW